MRNFIIGIFAIMLSGCGGGFKALQPSLTHLSSLAVCTQGTQQSCQADNGTGSQICNSAGSAWGACANLTSCNSGFNLQSGACVANVCTPNAQQSCQTGNGTGSQTCNSTGSVWGSCGNLTSCNSGFNLQNGVCVANVCNPNAQQSCQTGNGTGSQSCNGTGSAWGSCGNLASCNSGFNLQNGACVANICAPFTQQSCQTGKGTGSQMCNIVGSSWGTCENLTSCDSGYNLQEGVCVANATVPIIAPCPSNTNYSCATFVGTNGNVANVWLSNSTLYLTDSQLMGSFPNFNGHELAYIYSSDGQTIPHLFIIDLTTQSLVAWLSPSSGFTIYDTYFDYITDPSGNKYPFLAPGQHYLGVAGYPQWDFLCIFDPAYIGSPSQSCYTGFKPFSATFTTSSGQSAYQASGFRHNGGWVTDVDGDGWGDINLPFLNGFIFTISGQTGQQLGLSHFDPAAPVITPPVPEYFDSGRLYGGYTVFKDPSTGAQNTLIAAANAVGTFGDLYCNVSRYFEVTQWQGSQWQPVWDDYFSFTKTIFNLSNPQNESISNYLRLGNDLDGCTHRYANSLEWIGEHPYIIFDYFTKSNPLPDCQAQLLEEQASGFTDDAPYESVCAPSTLPYVTGTWSIRFIDVLNGAGVNANPNSYVWGRATNVIPGNSDLLLIQNFTSNNGVVTFNQTAASIDSFQLVQLNSIPSWNVVATASSPPASPTIISRVNYYGAYPAGIGASWGGIPELNLQDIDGDGLNDIELTNGQWLGWSAAQGKLVIK